jgi:hypothetical protein
MTFCVDQVSCTLPWVVQFYTFRTRVARFILASLPRQCESNKLSGNCGATE